MSSRRGARAALATVALLAAGLTAAPTTATAVAPTSPLTLHAPVHETVYAFRDRVYFDTPVQLIAIGQAFEIWSHRVDYRSPITSEWHHDSTVTPLPGGLMDDFSGLSRFLDVTIEDQQGRVVVHRLATACLNNYSTYRVVPGGAAHSTYPTDCPANIFARGSVQGIAAGWASDVPLFGSRALRLAPGQYTMRVAITPEYRSLFGIAFADAHRTVSLTVRPMRRGIPLPAARATRHTAAAPRLAGPRLTSAPTSGPLPDLAALPAWGIGLSDRGRQLNFSATVWNAGDSPLVVDGFREAGRAVMDSYQYFYDAQGNETGYVPAGHMVWDPRPTHHHWHFEDFARYQLLDSTRSVVQRSHKQAFCLANTDDIDYTVPGAQWRPYNTDLTTACGDYNALAVSEYLASGSGDTYEQFRAGQSFDVSGLPNGVYYVCVQANPAQVLSEQTAANNTSLRKIRLGGTPSDRTLHVYPVGDVVG